MDICKRIRELRQKRGMTLEQLAQLSGLTKGYLSKIERADSAPPFSTLESIAQALGADLNAFLETPSAETASRNIDIVRQNDELELVESSAGYDYRVLVHNYRNKYMWPFRMQIPPGTTGDLKHDGEEFVLILEGSVILEYEGRQYELAEGDSFYLDSRIKHRFTNKAKSDALLLAVHHPYRRF